VLTAAGRLGFLTRSARLGTEATVAGAILVAVTFGAMTRDDPSLLFLVVPILAWIATRFGLGGVALAGGVVGAAALTDALLAQNPFSSAEHSGATALALLQLYVAVIIVSAYVLAANVHARDETERLLRQNEAMLSAVIDGAPLPIVQVEPASGHVVGWNPAAERLFGWSADEVIGGPLPIVPEDDRTFHRTIRDSTVDRPEGFAVEAKRVAKDGTVLDVISSGAPIFDDDGRAIRLVAMVQDVTAMKAIEAELSYLAHHDPLTGSANRMLLIDRLEHLLARSRRSDARHALLFFDLDRFKAINDTYGHDIGDAVLKAVADRLTHGVREGDTVARLGGDEFVVLLEDVANDDAVQVLASRLAAAVAQPVAVRPGIVVEPGISAGMTTFDGHATDPAELLRRADHAMYAAKRGEGPSGVLDHNIDN
jgi:diguanylate cyclase (GGDEF)-like protein/PAS domain S-box-containing protein